MRGRKITRVQSWLIGCVMAGFAILGIYAVAASTFLCEVNAVREASASLLRQRDRFDHAYQFATSAQPSAIVRPVGELQQILMDTQDVAVPACLETAKGDLIRYMDSVVQAFLAYGAGEPDPVVRELIERSDEYHRSFRAEVEAARECAPFCLR